MRIGQILGVIGVATTLMAAAPVAQAQDMMRPGMHHRMMHHHRMMMRHDRMMMHHDHMMMHHHRMMMRHHRMMNRM